VEVVERAGHLGIMKLRSNSHTTSSRWFRPRVRTETMP
jgi:hypothetical protein